MLDRWRIRVSKFQLAGIPLIGQVKWNSGFNISWNTNEVLDLGEVSKLEYRTTYGGYKPCNGFMQLRVENPLGRCMATGTPVPGKPVSQSLLKVLGNCPVIRNTYDFNGDGRINSSDIMRMGNAIPDFIFGWNNRVSYKAFELTFLIQGSKG
jgi:hypothetical protein